MMKRIDSHHHLWDLKDVHYPWLMEFGKPRFFGDPTPIQRDYLLAEHRAISHNHGFVASVHIQVGAEDGLAEARWVDQVAHANPEWPMVQVAFCDLTAPDRDVQLDQFQALPSVVGVRQIVGRSPDEDAKNGTNALIADPEFKAGLHSLASRGLSFDLQLIPELMKPMGKVLEQVPDLQVALCHAGSPYDRSSDGIAKWAAGLAQLSALQNVSCKLSGLGMFDHDWNAGTVRPIADVVMKQFGPDRVMFGSNFPVCSLSSSFDELMERHMAIVPEEHHKAVFHDNAERFYFKGSQSS
ncbi:MAG: amidohydrolase family protein [Paracoccaceae bacterium]|jgi:predicted TIM-barrel fold metal-dependent hydrolase